MNTEILNYIGEEEIDAMKCGACFSCLACFGCVSCLACIIPLIGQSATVAVAGDAVVVALTAATGIS